MNETTDYRSAKRLWQERVQEAQRLRASRKPRQLRHEDEHRHRVTTPGAACRKPRQAAYWLAKRRRTQT